MKSIVVEDVTKKDEKGNGKFNIKLRKHSIFNNSGIYVIEVTRDVEKNMLQCSMKKEISSVNYYLYKIVIDKEKENIEVYYEFNKSGNCRHFNLLENDLMLTVKIKKEMNKVLSEFDAVSWSVKGLEDNKSTLIDIITDIIDLTEKNNTLVDGVMYSDFEVITTVIDGYFNEFKINAEKIELNA